MDSNISFASGIHIYLPNRNHTDTYCLYVNIDIIIIVKTQKSGQYRKQKNTDLILEMMNSIS